jgi:hypothetical protein
LIRRPRVLVLSSRDDFSSDYVVNILKDDDIPYLRLNSEDMGLWSITLDPLSGQMSCRFENTTFEVRQETLKSVWYRRACYPREYGRAPEGVEQQIARLQWSAFFRNLVIFDKALWMNHPSATYAAEQKARQLQVAQRLGFAVPSTIFANTASDLSSFSDSVVAKGIDTVLAHKDGQEFFAFASKLPRTTVESSVLNTIPLTVQDLIDPKLDLRVTVIGEELFAVEILKDGQGISGDWRIEKEKLEYRPFSLPSAVESKCKLLVKELGLLFAGIDLAFSEKSGEFYFLEINPTGEWAWLVDAAHLPIDKAIANVLRG